MSFITALYEGGSVTHFAPRDRAAVTSPGRTRVQVTKIGRVAQRAHSLVGHRTRRGAIQVLIRGIWNALRSVGLWIEEKSMQAHYRRVESYLAQSCNHADLERRMRELEHNDQLNWTDCGSR